MRRAARFRCTIAATLLLAGSSGFLRAQAPDQLPAATPAGVKTDAPSAQPGTIRGVVRSRDGAVYEGAQIRLTPAVGPTGPAVRMAISGSAGQFSFSDVPPGPFTLTVSGAGFNTQTASLTLLPGQAMELAPIALSLSASSTDVRVSATRTEVAEEQLREQERQRVLGIVPNFYVSYTPDAVPLNTKQKFHLSLRSEFDAVSLLGAAFTAGVGQAQNDPRGFGQGTAGYAKRFGAAFADDFVGTMIGSALLPSMLKQDPRYFYRGKGSVPRRALYAIANSVICKSDSGRWEPNYSRLIGGLAGAGIAQLYYPPADRHDAAAIFRNFGISKASGAAENLLQEFLIPHITFNVHAPRLPRRTAGN